jgi:hypothetical protein
MTHPAFDQLLASLKAVGVSLPPGKTYLDTTSESFKMALPVLMEHLEKEVPDNIREYILQHLSTPKAQSYRPRLVQLYRTSISASTQLKFRFAATIAATSRPTDLQENIALASDRSLGESRIGLLSHLARSRQVIALQALNDLLPDPDLTREIAAILKRKKRVA